MLHTIISQIGKCTYGIYLFHIIFLWKIHLLLNICTNIENRVPLWHRNIYYCFYGFCHMCSIDISTKKDSYFKIAVLT